MTHTDPISKARKLVELYRRGVGGERANAGRLLQAHLRASDLTLYDLDTSLPVTQDVTALDYWRESAALLSQLDGPQRDEILTRLVDADDLTDTELLRLLGAVDLETLTDLRADGWAYVSGQTSTGQLSTNQMLGLADEYRRAGREVTAQSLLDFPGSLAQRLKAAVLRAQHVRTHPLRLLRAEDDVQAHFLCGLVRALSGYTGEVVAGGVQAHLSADQLARLRALQAQYAAQVRAEALRAAEAFGAGLR